MYYNKVSFEGLISGYYENVNTDSAIKVEGDNLYFSGKLIPIRRNMWMAFIGEFDYRYQTNCTYHTIKFFITSEGSFMVKAYSGNKADNFIGRLMSIGSTDTWSSPRYGESEYKEYKDDY